MRVLALDTTTRAGSVAIVDDDNVVYEAAGAAERSHAERMPLEIAAALERAGQTLDAIDLFAVASGPGSFTGLRIGIATIQGLAMVQGRSIVPVSALAALAESARGAHVAGARIGAWMDAFRADVFSALFAVPAHPDDDLVELEAASVEPPAGVQARWSASGEPLAAMVGDGAVRYQALADRLAPVVPPGLLAATIGRIGVRRARRGQVQPPSAVQPLYVRRPDAVVARERHAREAAAGLDGNAASGRP